MNLREAIKVFNEYYACPECSNSKNVVNDSAIYHQSALTHRNFECKDCRQVFLVPSEVKITPMRPFRKPEQRKVIREIK